MLAYAGDDAAAQKALAPFRALATPYADFIKPGPYTSMYPPEDPDYHPTAVSRTMFMNRIGMTEAQQIVDTLNAVRPPTSRSPRSASSAAPSPASRRTPRPTPTAARRS